MSVLSREEILKAIQAGEIRIDPFDIASLGPASYDLKLSNEFRSFKTDLGVIDVNNESDYTKITEKIVLGEGEQAYLLHPHQSCLAITEETITLSPSYCGLLEGRSRFARLGLFVHITASFMQPGISNRQVLEIYNASNTSMALHPGTKICQFVFLKMIGEAQYNGQFKAQTL